MMGYYMPVQKPIVLSRTLEDRWIKRNCVRLTEKKLKNLKSSIYGRIERVKGGE